MDLNSITFLRKREDVYQVPREFLRELLDLLTSAPQYFFSAEFLTRNDRKNDDGTIRKAGTLRHLVCKRKPNLKPTKNWTSKGGKLSFDPVEKELYHVYTTEGANGDDGKGNHWGFICLRSCSQLKIMGNDFAVIEVR
jgi:hypothetical protein